jgi:VRR-NUC domain.
MTEMDLLNNIRKALSELGYCTFRVNVGTVTMADGRYFATGLPNGHSDLVAYKDGRVWFVEVKLKSGRVSRKQREFLDMMCTRYGCPGGVAYSVEDAVEICKRGYPQEESE